MIFSVIYKRNDVSLVEIVWTDIAMASEKKVIMVYRKITLIILDIRSVSLWL